MHLSNLLIDTGNDPDKPRPGRLWLRDLYRVHQRLCMAFPSAKRKNDDKDFLLPYKPEDFGTDTPGQVHVDRKVDSGFLYRIDPMGAGRVMILVQSAIKPDWDYAFHNAGHFLAASPEVKTFDPHFEAGQQYRFRLLANPTKKTGSLKKEERQALSKIELKEKKGRHGKRVFVEDKDLVAWLTKRAEGAGFSCDVKPEDIRPGFIYVTLSDSGQRLRSVLYEGALEITDAENFHAALIGGIGPAKAFGFGLLSVMPVRSSTAPGAE